MIDIASEVVHALRSDAGQQALGDALRAAVAPLLRTALDEHDEKLLPLASILGITDDAARKRLRRSPQLRAMGVPNGRRLVFKASVVQSYLASLSK
jgi:hypothetical protein